MTNATFKDAPCKSIVIELKYGWSENIKRALKIFISRSLPPATNESYPWQIQDLKDRKKEIQEDCKKHNITDIIVLYHGLNNPPKDAKKIYGSFLEQLDNLESKSHIVKTRSFLIIKVFWPSELLNIEYLQYYSFRKYVQDEGGDKGKEIINMLGELSTEQGIRLHLIGHSTGTILLAHSLKQCGNSVLVNTVVLIQSNITREEFKNLAVSLRQKILGDILITYKANDEMLIDHESMMYRSISNLLIQIDISKQETIGRHGVYEGEHDQDLCLPLGNEQIFEPKKVYNLNANIMNNHDDFKRQEIAEPILKAIAIT